MWNTYISEMIRITKINIDFVLEYWGIHLLILIIFVLFEVLVGSRGRDD